MTIHLADNKTCPKCGQRKPADAFNRNRARKSGLSDYCRDCMRIVLASYRERNRERLRVESLERYHKAYADPVKRERILNRSRKFRLANPGKVREVKRKAYLKGIASVRKYSREYYARNRDTLLSKWRAWVSANRDSEHERGRRYYRANADKVKLKAHRRRVAEGRYTVDQWGKIVAHYAPDGKCLCCGEARGLTVDHVIPIHLGGSNWPSNLQCLCISCNSGKGAKAIDYRPDRGKYAQSLQEL